MRYIRLLLIGIVLTIFLVVVLTSCGPTVQPKQQTGSVVILTPESPLETPETLAETEFFTSSTIIWANPVLGVVIDEQMTVIDVDAKSAAEVAGILKGDVLISVDGISFMDDKEKIRQLLWAYPSDGEAAYERLAAGKEWENTPHQLQLQRDGQVVDLAIIPRPNLSEVAPTPVPVELPLDYL